MSWLWIVFGLVVVFLGANLYWRYVARRTSAPCPAWLSWMLDIGGVDKPFGRTHTIEQLKLTPGLRIADVGCGPGVLTVPIARAVAPDGDVVALDIQSRMLDRLQRRIERAGVTNVRSLCAGAGEGALPHDYFDRAVLATVLGEIPDRERALREIYAALKPGGYLVVAEVIGDPHYQFKRKVIELGEKTGFRPGEHTGGFVAYTLRLYRPENATP